MQQRFQEENPNSGKPVYLPKNHCCCVGNEINFLRLGSTKTLAAIWVAVSKFSLLWPVTNNETSQNLHLGVLFRSCVTPTESGIKSKFLAQPDRPLNLFRSPAPPLVLATSETNMRIWIIFAKILSQNWVNKLLDSTRSKGSMQCWWYLKNNSD